MAQDGLMPIEDLTLIFGAPFLPLFVVMMITPLAARDPYKEDAAASFSTEMDSISLGFNVLITLFVLTM
ncbi:hypothetical protein D3C81_1150530 [compost metagenome]